MRVILLLLFTHSALAAMPKAFKVQIRHTKTALEYEWDGKSLEAKDRTMKASFNLTKCNEKMLSDFFEVEKFQFKNRPAKAPDTIRVKRNTENFEVSSRSSLGKYLLTLRDQLMLLKAQESVECK
jgi:hypothetical protein